MKKPHVVRYKKLLDEYMVLSKKTDIRDKNSYNFKKLMEIGNQINVIRRQSEQHKIVCVESCYVGQGMSFEPGEVVQSYIDKDDATDHLNRINKDSWGKGCFAVETFPPDET